jgi:hypothetical protein
MKVTPVAFSANGQIGTAGFTAAIDSPLTNAAFQPTYMDASQGLVSDGTADVDVPASPEYLVGFAYTGFTKVVFYNGVDNTGDIVAVGGAAGSYGFNYEINCAKGLYVEVTGSGRGTAWLA